MCGRFEGYFPEGKLESPFDDIKWTYEQDDEKLKIHDIRPTNKIKCYYRDKDEFIVANVNWGIKFSPKMPLLINSRIETIKDKPYWFKMFDRYRAIVPMSAFYEWITEKGKKKQQRIFIKGMDIFFVPSIYHKKDDEVYVSFITVPSNKFMTKLHNRMPAILNEEQARNYLTDEAEANLAKCVTLSDKIKMGFEPFEK